MYDSLAIFTALLLVCIFLRFIGVFLCNIGFMSYTARMKGNKRYI